MSPSDSPPVSPRLLNQLARTLRAIEQARREEPTQRDEAVGSALEDLEVLSGHVDGAADGSLPDGIPERLDATRTSLEDGEVENARETLVEVGRSIDAFLKG